MQQLTASAAAIKPQELLVIALKKMSNIILLLNLIQQHELPTKSALVCTCLYYMKFSCIDLAFYL